MEYFNLKRGLFSFFIYVFNFSLSVGVECPEPDIKNAKWKDGSRPPYKYNNFVTYECERGFTLQGKATITCGINSQWSPGLPQCIRKSLDEIES